MKPSTLRSLKRAAMLCAMLAFSALLARTNDWIPIGILWAAFVASLYPTRLDS